MNTLCSSKQSGYCLLSQYKQDHDRAEDDDSLPILNPVFQSSSSLTCNRNFQKAYDLNQKTYSVKDDLIDFIYQESKSPFVTVEDVKHTTNTDHLFPIRNAITCKQKSLIDIKNMLPTRNLDKLDEDSFMFLEDSFLITQFLMTSNMSHSSEAVNSTLIDSRKSDFLETGESLHSSFIDNSTKVYHIPFDCENTLESHLSSKNSHLFPSQINLGRQKSEVEYKELYSFNPFSQKSSKLSTSIHSSKQVSEADIEKLQPVNRINVFNDVPVQLRSTLESIDELIDFGMAYPLRKFKDNNFSNKLMQKTYLNSNGNLSDSVNASSAINFKEACFVHLSKSKTKFLEKNSSTTVPSLKLSFTTNTFENISKKNIIKSDQLDSKSLYLQSNSSQLYDKISTCKLSLNCKESSYKTKKNFSTFSQKCKNFDMPFLKEKSIQAEPCSILEDDQLSLLSSVIKSPLFQFSQINDDVYNSRCPVLTKSCQQTKLLKNIKDVSQLCIEKPYDSVLNSKSKNFSDTEEKRQDEELKTSYSSANSKKMSNLPVLKNCCLLVNKGMKNSSKNSNNVSLFSRSSLCDNDALSFPYQSCDNVIQTNKRCDESTKYKDSDKVLNIFQEKKSSVLEYGNTDKFALSQLNNDATKSLFSKKNLMLSSQTTSENTKKLNVISPLQSLKSSSSSFLKQQFSGEVSFNAEFMSQEPINMLNVLKQQLDVQDSLNSIEDKNNYSQNQKVNSLLDSNQILTSASSGILVSSLKDDTKQNSSQFKKTMKTNKLLIPNSLKTPKKFQNKSYFTKQRFLRNVSFGIPKDFEEIASAQASFPMPTDFVKSTTIPSSFNPYKNNPKKEKICHPGCFKLTRPEYYTRPPFDLLESLINEQGRCLVTDFVIGRKGYGSILFEGLVDIMGINFDEIVQIRRKEVTVYPQDVNKPPVGFGLNRRAEVALDNSWPIDSETLQPITDPVLLRKCKWEQDLELITEKMGAHFLEFRYDTGSWVFLVDHFSKYSLLDNQRNISCLKTLQVEDQFCHYTVFGNDNI